MTTGTLASGVTRDCPTLSTNAGLARNPDKKRVFYPQITPKLNGLACTS